MTFEAAHAAASGGMNIEAIVLAVGVVVLGAAFLVQKTVDPKVSILLVAIGIAGIVASLTFLKDGSTGGGSITVQGQTYTEEELEEAVLGLCAARDAAQSDVDEANAIFIDRVHVPLHVVVGALQDDDRALAGRILEAKQKVEQDLIENAPSEVLVKDLDALNNSATFGLERLSMSPPLC